MTTVLNVLGLWVALSVPAGLLLARLFRSPRPIASPAGPAGGGAAEGAPCMPSSVRAEVPLGADPEVGRAAEGDRSRPAGLLCRSPRCAPQGATPAIDSLSSKEPQR